MDQQVVGPERRARFVDGGAVLLARPYTDEQWAPVARAWWWHMVGVYVLAPVYPLVALTVWQRPSRQPLVRRVAWAAILTAGALVVVGVPALVVFSRRWYWLHRTGTDPRTANVPAEPPPQAGYYPWAATTGRRFADWVARSAGTGSARVPARPPAVARPAPVPMHARPAPVPMHARPAPVPVRSAHQPYAEPWASLLAEAARDAERIRWAAAQAPGPAAARVADAHREAVAAVQAAHHLADRAVQIEAAVRHIDVATVERRIASLDAAEAAGVAGPGGPDADDRAAARRSLADQRDTADRMRRAAHRLQLQLERLVAQLGEAAARADELALGVLPADAPAPGLTGAIDGLTAIREALDTVDQPG